MFAVLGRAGVALVMLASATVADAQSPPTVLAHPGDRVRLWSDDGRPREGVLQRADRDSVFLQIPGGATVAAARARVTRVQVQGGSSRRAGARRGAKIGALVGAVAGVLLATGDSGCYSGGQEVQCPPQLENSIDLGEGAFIVFLTAGLGALAGGAVGSALPATPWRDARLPTADVSGEPKPECRIPRADIAVRGIGRSSSCRAAGPHP